MKYSSPESFKEIKNAARASIRNFNIVTKPGKWTATNNYLFYLVQAHHTKFDDSNKPMLNNMYFSEREIEIIEEVERIALKARNESSESVPNYVCIGNCLTFENSFNIERSTDTMHDIVKTIQQITGSIYTVRQINNKHINMRSRIATPFISLHESGYFYRNALKMPEKLSVKELVELCIGGKNYEFYNNLDPKFFNLIKTILRFNTHRHLFWDSKAEACFDYSNIEKMEVIENDFTESDRWVHAMVAVHGQKMLDFMERCTLNLLNTYITKNLDSTKLEAAVPKFIHIYKMEHRLKVFDIIVDELVEMGMQRPLKIDSNIGSNAGLPSKKKRRLNKGSSLDMTSNEDKDDALNQSSTQSSESTEIKPAARDPLPDIMIDTSRPVQLVSIPGIEESQRIDNAIDMNTFIGSTTNAAPISSAFNFTLPGASNLSTSLSCLDACTSFLMPRVTMNAAFPPSSLIQPFNQIPLQLPQATWNGLHRGSAMDFWNNSPATLVQPDHEGNAWLNSLFAEQEEYNLASNKKNL